MTGKHVRKPPGVHPPDPRTWNVRNGGCGVSLNSDTVCDRPAGHLPHLLTHKAHDPSGSGRWVEFDDDGYVVRTGRGLATDRYEPRHSE